MNTRTTTWNKLGTALNTFSLEEALNESTLNFEVEKRPLFYQKPDGTLEQVEDKMATYNKDTNKYLGVVGRNYSVVQNQDAFEVAQLIADRHNMKFIKGGQTSHGVSYLIGMLESYTVLDDKFDSYVIFQNSFTGINGINAVLSPVRFVCQNQFPFKIEDFKNYISIRHTLNISAKMGVAEETFSDILSYQQVLQVKASEWVGIKVDTKQLDDIITQFIPITGDMSELKTNRAEQERERFLACYKEQDNTNYVGNMWGVVNAYSDFITHKPVIRKSENADESTFLNVTMNNNFENFMRIAVSVVK